MSTPELYFEECSECKKKFHSNVELKVHMKLMHPKIDEFNCNICDKKFKRRWSLRSHLNFVHGVQENKGNFFFFRFSRKWWILEYFTKKGNSKFSTDSRTNFEFRFQFFTNLLHFQEVGLFWRKYQQQMIIRKICSVSCSKIIERKFGIRCRISWTVGLVIYFDYSIKFQVLKWIMP